MINITTLSENTATGNFIAEWGLSVFIDVDGYRILFDTGAGNALIYNAKILDVDFSLIDKIILSHGHFDHTGGLADLLEIIANDIEVLGHPDIWTLKYSCKQNQAKRYIGIQDYPREHFESLGANFILSKEPVWLTENIVTSGEIPMKTDYEDIDAKLFVKEDLQFKPDTLADDLCLGIKTRLGLVIILGCSHRGMINNIKHMQQVTGEERVHCVVGGTHLMAASDVRIEKTIKDLKKIDVKKIGVSHCTGFKASTELFKHFPGAFFNNNAGTQITLAD